MNYASQEENQPQTIKQPKQIISIAAVEALRM